MDLDRKTRKCLSFWKANDSRQPPRITYKPPLLLISNERIRAIHAQAHTLLI